MCVGSFGAGDRAFKQKGRVFLTGLEGGGSVMRMAGFRGAQKLSKIFDLKATHPPMIAGIIGAIVDIGKRWIESDFAEPVEKVVERAAVCAGKG